MSVQEIDCQIIARARELGVERAAEDLDQEVDDATADHFYCDKRCDVRRARDLRLYYFAAWHLKCATGGAKLVDLLARADPRCERIAAEWERFSEQDSGSGEDD